MVFSRRSGEEEDDRPRNPNPNIHLRSPRSKITKDEQHVRRQIGMPICKEELEALVRKVVREEVHQALCLHAPLQRSSLDETEPSVARRFLLCFDSKFPNRVFTGNKIEAEGTEPLKVVLKDATTGAVVTDGPFSSIRIECVALQGDFKAEEQTNWTEKEFNENILREREGRRPLLIGDRIITLNHGVGLIKDVSFTDNSSWVRSKRFRLGVKVAQGLFPDVGVQEAVSGAFEVRDRRGEPYQKHGTPSLEDEVWRLSKIAKDGPHSKRLAANGIRTVKDFLQRYYTDESSLRNILGVSNRVWEAIVEHAKSCSLNNDHYTFSADDGIGLLFNCVLDIIGVTYDGQNYQSLEALSKAQKLQVDKIRRYAYQHQNQLILTDVPATDSDTSSPCGPIVLSTSSSLTDMQLLEIEDSQLPLSFGTEQSHPHPGKTMNDQQFHVPSLLGDLFTGFYEDEPTWFQNFPNEPSSTDGLFSMEDDMIHVQTSAWLPITPSSMGASTSKAHVGGILSPLPNIDDNVSPASKKSNAGRSKVKAALMLKVQVGKDGDSGGKKLPSYH